jgi:hypothetical protein
MNYGVIQATLETEDKTPQITSAHLILSTSYRKLLSGTTYLFQI